MKKALAVVLALGLVLGASSTDDQAEAAVIAMDTNALTDGSTLVMRAAVTDRTVAWTEEGPGGELGGIKIRNAEAPEFGLGEQVVVFIKPAAAGKNRIYGWFQGKYTLLGNDVRELNGVDYETFRGQILAALND